MTTLRDTIPLKKSKIFKKSLGRMLGVTLLLTVFYLCYTFFSFFGAALPVSSINVTTLTLLLAAILCGIPIYQFLYWRRYHYDMDEKNIVIRKGVIAQKEITLPFSRMTDVYVQQDAFDAVLGLYDVHFSTPTQEPGQFAHIDGVSRIGAQQLRQMVLKQVNDDGS